jgi:hypothetical protein
MSTKYSVMIGLTVGSVVGGYAPVLFGGSALSYTSVITGTIGSVIGIIFAYKLSQKYS